jgi:hypothetical protein
MRNRSGLLMMLVMLFMVPLAAYGMHVIMHSLLFGKCNREIERAEILGTITHEKATILRNEVKSLMEGERRLRRPDGTIDENNLGHQEINRRVNAIVAELSPDVEAAI